MLGRAKTLIILSLPSSNLVDLFTQIIFDEVSYFNIGLINFLLKLFLGFKIDLLPL